MPPDPTDLLGLISLAALDRASRGPFADDGSLTEEAQEEVRRISELASDDEADLEELAAELDTEEEEAEAFAEGQPCKPGQTAEKTGCKPSREDGERFERQQKDLRTSGVMAADPPVNEAYMDALAERMAEEGWVGRPLLVVSDGADWQAWTGSHRLGAAQKAGLDTVPAIVIRRSDVEEAAEKAGFEPDVHPSELDDEQKAELFAHLDNDLVKELIRLELEQGGRAFE